MNRNNGFFLHPTKNRRGQILPLAAISMAAILGMAALVLNVGTTYYSYSELQASTNAAAFAGAYAMAQPGSSATTIGAAVTAYSSVSGDKNAHANLPGVSIPSTYPQLKCNQTLVTLGYGCVGGGGTAVCNSNATNAPCYNALIVQQQVTVPMAFAQLFGTPTLTLKATATAAMRGAPSGPFNVVMLMDSTASMNNIQNSTDCKASALSCALSGVQVLLQNLSPCPPNLTTCGTATQVTGPPAYGYVTPSVDRVSLLTFPPVSTATAVDDFNCGRTTPTIVPYATPFPATSTYQIVGFSSDYRGSDTTTTLSASSDLVAAVGGKAGCTGLQAIGGDGTYYAQAIYQAEAYLLAEQAGNPGSRNVLILLSDGDANSTCNSSSKGVCTSGPMTGAFTVATVYPSVLDQCHQAIAAAQTAWQAGITIYAVNFGAEASGCSTDTPVISPCQTMLQMATYPPGSTSTTYFSDDPATGTDPTCVAAARPTSSLNQIFQAIAGDLTVARLIPNGTL